MESLNAAINKLSNPLESQYHLDIVKNLLDLLAQIHGDERELLYTTLITSNVSNLVSQYLKGTTPNEMTRLCVQLLCQLSLLFYPFFFFGCTSIF